MQENISLAPYTSLGIGGPTPYFTEARSENTVLDAVEFSRAHNLPLCVLGGGSNILISDSGFPGLVLQVAIPGISMSQDGDSVTVSVGAGVRWDPLVADCVDRGLAGIECLSGIPGWVGGTPVGNVGAYGQEVSAVISNVRAYDRQHGNIIDMSNAQCRFAYRSSVFNTTARNRYIVLKVEYVLEKGGAACVRYSELERFFRGRTPTLSEVRVAVRKIRADKAMLLVEGDADCRSAGSFFKNPVVSEATFASIEAVGVDRGVLGPGRRLPRFPASAGQVKAPAAWLIEQAGFPKGCSRGNVGLSRKHALALVNRGGATADEVLAFAGEIQEAVESTFGVRLAAEPAFVGFSEEVRRCFGAAGPNGP
jgi:UDP-N-acetylmuramate dehydrogenase